MDYAWFLFSFEGRINRAKYWLTLIVWFLIWAFAVIVALVGGLAILGGNLTDGALPDTEDTTAWLRLIRDYAVLSSLF